MSSSVVVNKNKNTARSRLRLELQSKRCGPSRTKEDKVEDEATQSETKQALHAV
jgi:hypothetical protein